jgi:adenylylsulfate kinase
MPQLNELYTVKSKITQENRVISFGQIPKLIWFTGLSGSGKSTIAVQLESALFDKGYKTYLLDGDNIRGGLNRDLDFTDQGRIENIRRIAEVANLMIDSGIIVLAAFISPFRKNRDSVRKIIGLENYIEVFVDTPLEICEQRDVKGLYKRARSGELKNFTGISSPYEIPDCPDFRIQTVKFDQEEIIDLLLKFVLDKIKIK